MINLWNSEQIIQIIKICDKGFCLMGVTHSWL